MRPPMTSLELMLALTRIEYGTKLAHGTHYEPSSVIPHINDVRDEVHHRNVVAGWWTNLATGERIQRNVGELLMLAVSELAEVPRYDDFASVHDDKLTDRLMAEVEIADFCIRIFDIAGGTGVPLGEWFVAAFARCDPSINLSDIWLMNIIRAVADAMEANRKGRQIAYAEAIGAALYGAFRFADFFGFKLAEAIYEKMEFNATRADHKIENRVKRDGKKY